MIEVYARRRFSPEAGALVDQLRAEGRTARQQDPRHFDEKQVDRGTVLVYHDGTDPLVPWVYGRRGIACELIPALVGKTTHGSSDDRYLVRTGTGFTLHDAHGNLIGTEQANEADAWAQGETDGLRTAEIASEATVRSPAEKKKRAARAVGVE